MKKTYFQFVEELTEGENRLVTGANATKKVADKQKKNVPGQSKAKIKKPSPF
jgi:hypothetical protein